jgi:2-desacetyl-2-hydroxyethyl bacteriochlorophyllide A dehydrogenase
MKNKKIWVSDLWKTEFTEHDDNIHIENENDVIVKNLYTHLSAGTEIACLSGLEGWFPIPNTPGYTGIGKVIEKGSAVDKVNIGDLVYTYSTHSQFFKLNITDRWHGVCVKLPPDVNPEWASFTHMAGIALTAIRNSHIELGDFVLVSGQGAIGNLAAQLAQLQGATVIVSDINDNRLDISLACGLKNTVNSLHQDIKEKVMEFTANKGVSTFIDATGIAQVIHSNAECVASNGEIILLGSPRAPFETNITKFLGHFHYLPFNHTLRGALEFTFPTQTDDFNKHSIERNAEIILRLIAENRLHIQPLLSHTLNPADCQKAYEGLRDNGNEYIGVIFDWTRE